MLGGPLERSGFLPPSGASNRRAVVYSCSAVLSVTWSIRWRPSWCERFCRWGARNETSPTRSRSHSCFARESSPSASSSRQLHAAAAEQNTTFRASAPDPQVPVGSGSGGTPSLRWTLAFPLLVASRGWTASRCARAGARSNISLAKGGPGTETGLTTGLAMRIGGCAGHAARYGRWGGGGVRDYDSFESVELADDVCLALRLALSGRVLR